MWKKKYEYWIENINDNFENLSHEELEDRFYKDLEFGTAGIRGKLGEGTNRMNDFNISLVTQALANVINKENKKDVVIAYDVRHCSKDFAELAARVLAANGIKAYLFSDIKTTPLLSFAVRELKTTAGIMITASHNPKDYNGYKVYWKEGSQILDHIANKVKAEIENISIKDIEKIELQEGIDSEYIELLNDDIENKFHSIRLNQTISDEINKDISVIYTPLNGTGSKPVMSILKDRGFNNIYIVKEQEDPDPNFTTTPYPNPENIEVFKLARKLGKQKNADLLIATDPDCDRVGVMVKNNDEYMYLNGNEIGALLVNYILSNKKFTNPAIVKSIVTSNLGKVIAEDYGAKVFDTLIGFKYICEKANMWDETKEYEFIFGYEESLGYTYKTLTRDKDAVISAMLIVEMAAYYKNKKQTLVSVLKQLYEKYGIYKEELLSVRLEGVEGSEKITKIMSAFRNIDKKEIKNLKILKTIDYLNDKTDMPKSNIMQYDLLNGTSLIIRPSGTEPLIKIYINIKAKSNEEVKKQIELLKEFTNKIINSA